MKFLFKLEKEKDLSTLSKTFASTCFIVYALRKNEIIKQTQNLEIITYLQKEKKNLWMNWTV